MTALARAISRIASAAAAKAAAAKAASLCALIISSVCLALLAVSCASSRSAAADLPVGNLASVTNLDTADRVFIVRSNGAARMLTNWAGALASAQALAAQSNAVVALVLDTSNSLRAVQIADLATASNALFALLVPRDTGVATNLTITGDWWRLGDFTFTNFAGAGIDIGTSEGRLMQSWSVDGSVDLHGEHYYWGPISDANHITTKGYVDAATNGLAGTNLIYRIQPGTNMVAVTNGWNVTLSSTASGGGGATNFHAINVTNSIYWPSSGSSPRWRQWYDASSGNLLFDRHHSGGGSTVLRLRDIPYTSTNEVISLNATGKKISLYNSYTDAANYEEAQVGWVTNALVIGTTSAGTGSGRPVVIGKLNDTSGHAFMTFNDNFVAIGTNAPSTGYPLRITSLGGNVDVRLGGGYPALRTIYLYAGDSISMYLPGPAIYCYGAPHFSPSNMPALRVFNASGTDSGKRGIIVFSDNNVSANTNTTMIGSWTNRFFVANAAVWNPSLTFTNLVCDTLFRTNCLYGDTVIENIVGLKSGGQLGKSITNTWYSVGSDGTGVVTNRQVFLNGILTSWSVNGAEL